MIDVLSKIQQSQEAFRAGAAGVLQSLRQPVPETEQEWLRFALNQRLRNMGIGKPLPIAEGDWIDEWVKEHGLPL